MALFKKKKEETAPKEKVRAEESSKEKVKKQSEERQSSPAQDVFQKDVSRVLRAPRITEKATFASENGAYVFTVDSRATKKDIANAIEAVYKVKPAKVNVAKVPSKKLRTRLRGVFGTKSGGKKAYVYLKEGDTIEVV